MRIDGEVEIFRGGGFLILLIVKLLLVFIKGVSFWIYEVKIKLYIWYECYLVISYFIFLFIWYYLWGCLYNIDIFLVVGL